MRPLLVAGLLILTSLWVGCGNGDEAGSPEQSGPSAPDLGEGTSDPADMMLDTDESSGSNDAANGEAGDSSSGTDQP